MLAMTSEAHNEVFNVGTGVPTTVRELADILIKALGSKVEPEFSGRPTLVSRRKADLTKIRELLGYEPKMEVHRGLTEVARAIAAHPDSY
jgi:nucleoside-diphosphate-sugar epimerase